MSKPEVAIVGIGMHPFGRTPERTGQEQGVYAVREALKDAGVEWSDVQFAFGGSAAAGAADTMVSKLGLTGLQFINVANGCATGGSALFSAYNTIASGAYDLGMAVGYDKHERGAFRVNTRGAGLGDWYGKSGMALTTQFFGMKINRYMEQYDISHSTLAKVSAKAFRNAEHNPKAWRRQPISEEQILESEMLSYPLTKFMFCSPAEGGVALLLAKADKAHKYTDTPIYLNAAAVRSRRWGSFEVMSPWIAADDGPGPTVDTSKAAFEMAGMGPEDIDFAQLQDTEAGAEIMHMAENGFCEHGEQERMIQDGETEIGGRFPVNTDGGCLANGEPVGASGLRQVYENVLQLRGQAGKRQVPNDPKVAYTHVYGAPGISGVTILSR
jgi:acetyl-CoA acetyltransferase